MQSIWPIVTVAGPLLLLAAIMYVTIRNKIKDTPRDEAFSDHAAKQVREEERKHPDKVEGPLG